jgi:soluble lytic murein transglycosylase-like protein
MRLPRLKTKQLRRLRKQLPSQRDCLMLLLGGLLVFICFKIVLHMQNTAVPLNAQASAITIPWLPPTVKRWEAPVTEMAKKYNVDPNLIAIIITLESGGDPTAVSADNAHGLMQITPPTAKDIAAKYLKKPVTTYNLEDPQTNIEFGAAYLAYLRSEFGASEQGPSWNSTVELIAAGYNGGPGAAARLEKGTGLTDMQTVTYSRDAYNMWRERHAAVSPTYNRWRDRGGSHLVDAATHS